LARAIVSGATSYTQIAELVGALFQEEAGKEMELLDALIRDMRLPN
jgi:hypothetical protein